MDGWMSGSMDGCISYQVTCHGMGSYNVASQRGHRIPFLFEADFVVVNLPQQTFQFPFQSVLSEKTQENRFEALQG